MRTVSIQVTHPTLKVDRKALRKLLSRMDQWDRFQIPPGELSLVFPDSQTMQQIHHEFLQLDSLTDVITFEGDPNMEYAGEIFVSADQARLQAPGFYSSPEQEILLYLVHGWLHLAGLNDLTPNQRIHMREAEAEALQFLSPSPVSGLTLALPNENIPFYLPE